MEREQLNRIRPGGAEEWKQRRAQGGAGEQKASDPQAPAGERTQPHPQAPAGTHIQILPQPLPVEKKAPQAPAAERKAPQPSLPDEERKPAQTAAEDQKAPQDPDEKLKRSYLVKLLAMLVLAGAIVLYTTIAWFTMNKETSSSGMGVKVQAGLFELKTSGSEGIYDNYITRVDSEYSSGSQTSPSSSKLILQMTNDYQMDNLWKKNTPPTQEELDSIKRIESTQYGLSPGDHGILKFSIVPVREDSGSFAVRIKPVITYYKTEYYTTDDTGYIAGYQKDVVAAMDSNNASEGMAMGFANTHISMYYMADEDDDGEDEMHLIPDDGFIVSEIASETEVKIYWIWPEELSDILSLDVEGMDTSGVTELRKEFFAFPDRYLEIINESDDFSSIVISKSGTEAARDSKAQEILDSPTSYNYYSNRYNNADQTIGDKVGYIMVEIIASQAD